MKFKRLAKGEYLALASNGDKIKITDVYDPSGALVNKTAKHKTKHWKLTIRDTFIGRYYTLADAKEAVPYYI